MLTRIRIRKFRSCSDVDVSDLRPLTLLVGPNGAGKTNTLKAVELAARTAVSTKEIDLPPDSEITLEIRLKGKNFRYRIGYGVRAFDEGRSFSGSLREGLWEGNRDDDWIPVVERDGDAVRLLPSRRELTIEADNPGLPAILSLLPHQSVSARIRQVVQFLRNVRYYPMEEPSEPEQGPDADILVEEKSYRGWPADQGKASE